MNEWIIRQGDVTQIDTFDVAEMLSVSVNIKCSLFFASETKLSWTSSLNTQRKERNNNNNQQVPIEFAYIYVNFFLSLFLEIEVE